MNIGDAPRSALGHTQMAEPPTQILTYYDLPLTRDTVVRITGPFPLSIEEMDRLQLLLNVMAPGLTRGLPEGAQ